MHTRDVLRTMGWISSETIQVSDSVPFLIYFRNSELIILVLYLEFALG